MHIIHNTVTINIITIIMCFRLIINMFINMEGANDGRGERDVRLSTLMTAGPRRAD